MLEEMLGSDERQTLGIVLIIHGDTVFTFAHDILELPMELATLDNGRNGGPAWACCLGHHNATTTSLGVERSFGFIQKRFHEADMLFGAAARGGIGSPVGCHFAFFTVDEYLFQLLTHVEVCSSILRDVRPTERFRDLDRSWGRSGGGLVEELLLPRIASLVLGGWGNGLRR